MTQRVLTATVGALFSAHLAPAKEQHNAPLATDGEPWGTVKTRQPARHAEVAVISTVTPAILLAKSSANGATEQASGSIETKGQAAHLHQIQATANRPIKA